MSKKPSGGWGKNLDYAAIEQDRIDGLAVKKIAKKHRCAEATVWAILRNNSHRLPQHLWVRVEQNDYRALHLVARKNNVDIKTMAAAVMADAIAAMIVEEGITEAKLAMTPAEFNKSQEDQ